MANFGKFWPLGLFIFDNISCLCYLGFSKIRLVLKSIKISLNVIFWISYRFNRNLFFDKFIFSHGCKWMPISKQKINIFSILFFNFLSCTVHIFSEIKDTIKQNIFRTLYSDYFLTFFFNLNWSYFLFFFK